LLDEGSGGDLNGEEGGKGERGGMTTMDTSWAIGGLLQLWW